MSIHSDAGWRWRWWGCVAGVVTSIGDGVLVTSVGIQIQLAGHDATWPLIFYFGSTFALLGYLIGWLVEARRRDKLAADQIRSQLETVAALRARLAQSEKLAVLGQLASAIAHEVRNPLAVIRSVAQELGDEVGVGHPEARTSTGFITDEVDRLNRVISSLLAFAKPLHLAPRSVNCRDLVDRAVLLARDDLAQRHIALHRDEGGSLPPIQVDPDLISQVLVGLVANAAEALDAGGRIAIRTTSTAERCEIEVSDSGPGVPVELRDRIFEPFFTTRARGTGLGLAVARQIVEAHGGRLSVDDQPGGGARFHLSLPLASPQALAA